MIADTIYVSPAEPAFFRPPNTEFVSNVILERCFGADFLTSTPSHQIAGIQRKTVEDLIASVRGSDRLAREIPQLQTFCHHRLLILEGKPKWTSDGQLLSRHVKFTRGQLYSLLLSLQITHQIPVLWTESEADTLATVRAFFAWVSKDRTSCPSSLLTRPGPGAGVNNTDRAWQVHFLQGLPGIGQVQAERVLDHFASLGAALEAMIRGDSKALCKVQGIGKDRAARIVRMFGGKS